MNEEILDKQLYVDGFKHRNWSVRIMEVVAILALTLFASAILYLRYQDWLAEEIDSDQLFEALFSIAFFVGPLFYFSYHWRLYSIKIDTARHKKLKDVHSNEYKPYPYFIRAAAFCYFGLALFNLFPGRSPSAPEPEGIEAYLGQLFLLHAIIHLLYDLLTSFRVRRLDQYLSKGIVYTAEEIDTE